MATDIYTKAEADAALDTKSDDPRFVIDDGAVTAAANLTTHTPTRGGALAKASGYDGDLIGTGDAIAMAAAGDALYTYTAAPGQRNVSVTRRIRVDAIPANGAVSVGFCVRRQGDADTHLSCVLRTDGDEWEILINQRVDGEEDDIFGEEIEPLEVDDEIELRLDVIGDRCVLIVDGEAWGAGEIEDEDLADNAGAVGLLASVEDNADAAALVLVDGTAANPPASAPLLPINAGQVGGLPQAIDAALKGQVPTGGWEEVNFAGDLQYYDEDGFLVIEGNPGAGATMRLLQRDLGNPDWMSCVIDPAWAWMDNDRPIGIGLRESATGKLFLMYLYRDEGAGKLAVVVHSDPDTETSAPQDINLTALGIDIARPWQLSMRISGGSVIAFACPEGLASRWIQDLAVGSVFTTAPDKFVLMVNWDDEGSSVRYRKFEGFAD